MFTKRFALLCQHFYPEMISTGMHMTELATRLSELGWQITVYCARPSWGTETAEASPITEYQGVQIVRVPTVGDQQSGLFSRALFAISFLLATGWRLWRERKQFPGLVLTTNPPFLGLLGWLFSRLFGKPYLLIVYDVYPDIAVNLGILSRRSLVTRLWERVTRLIFRHAAVLVVIGRDMAEVVRGKVPVAGHGRITLIPNWSDERHIQPIPAEANRFRQEQGLNGHFLVQYAGRMGRTHNLEPLIEAARLLADEAVHFQFVGEGAKKAKLEALTRQYELHNVTFLPHQPMNRLAEMLSAADLAVVCLEPAFTGLSVPSKSYGILASGTPILGFMDAENEISQMIQETGCGLVLEEAESPQIATIIRTLSHDPQHCNAMAQAGRQAFLHCYTLEHAAQAYDKALTTMLVLPKGEQIMNLQSNKPLGQPLVAEPSPIESFKQKYESIQIPFSERRALLGIMDVFCLIGAVGIAFYLWKWDEGLSDNIAQRWYWFPILILTWQTLAWLNDLYDIPSANYKTLTAVRVFTVGFLTLFLYLVVYFVSPWKLPRIFFIYFLIVALPLIIAWRCTYAVIFAASPFRHRVLIVGNNKRGRIIADLLQQHKHINHQVLGCIDDGETAVTEDPDHLPLLGTESDLMPLVKQLRVHEIVVAIDRNLERELFLALVECQANGVQISWMPDLYEKMSRCVPIQHIDPAWALSAMQNQRHLQARAKRVLDLFVLIGGSLIFLFVLPIISLAIYLDSPGPIFYRQYRCGLAGKPFKIVKFRTMVTDAEKDGQARWATKHDPRITRMGRFLRKSRLDELPQLLNVLRGEMSIVGPRPERPEFVEKLELEIPYYRTRLLAKPGITGWAQLHHEYGNTVEDAIIKLQYDFYYIRYQSITLDIYTMFRTVGVLLRLKGM